VILHADDKILRHNDVLFYSGGIDLIIAQGHTTDVVLPWVIEKKSYSHGSGGFNMNPISLLSLAIADDPLSLVDRQLVCLKLLYSNVGVVHRQDG